MRELKPDLIEEVTRYNLWLIPNLPMDAPLYRPRQRRQGWRSNLLADIKANGLRHPILVYGHSPKGKFNLQRWGDLRPDVEGVKKFDMYIAFGTNRFYCLQELGATTFPAIVSWNKGKTPPWEGKIITPEEFRDYAPEGRIVVQDHGFGYTVKTKPEEEFS